MGTPLPSIWIHTSTQLEFGRSAGAMRFETLKSRLAFSVEVRTALWHALNIQTELQKKQRNECSKLMSDPVSKQLWRWFKI